MTARFTALAAVLALVLVACSTGKESASGPIESIGVHGAWTIEVTNPDGSTASSQRFENALASTGDGLLSAVLSRDSAAGGWSVNLPAPVGGTGPCGAAVCSVAEPGSRDPGANVFETLTVTPVYGADAKLVLNGSFVATADGEINRVLTQLGLCDGTVAPETCASAPPLENTLVFTLKELGTTGDQVPVAAGQTVEVTVEISFGTLP